MEVYGIRLLDKPWVIVDWFDDFFGENEYSFLSNFYQEAPFFWEGNTWQTGEHAFQAMKATNDSDFIQIRDAISPGEAKLLGNSIQLRANWEQIKFQIMHDLTWAKFSTNEKLTEKLLSTGSAYLQEGTFWGDKIWGVDLLESETPHLPMTRIGRNWLGIILMDVRARLTFMNQ